MEKAVQKADEHFTETMKEISTAKAERDKIVEQRNAEADYSQALEDASAHIVGICGYSAGLLHHIARYDIIFSSLLISFTIKFFVCWFRRFFTLDFFFDLL